ncbi:MAG TPA: histidinol-phosphatase [Bacteroidales bacterium]|nr:histidinol-phosphatase [Bacteroidales bacterium]
MIYKTDYHIHSNFSDGRSAPKDYIAPAVEAGFSEIGISDHLNLFKYNKEWCMNPENISEYIDHIGSIGDGIENIKIKTGLEVDYFPGKETEIEAFLKPLHLDYVIGSVHYLGEQTVDNGPEFYEGKDIDILFESYFDTVIKAAASDLFDIIGHCDLIRIYGHRPSFDPEPFYRKLARTMKKHDVVFEVNTNGRNRPLADFYPDRRFLSIFQKEKVPVCVNSDAHLTFRVGQYFDEVYELLRYTGFNEMATFNKRERKMIPF